MGPGHQHADQVLGDFFFAEWTKVMIEMDS